MEVTFKELMVENGYKVKTTFWDDFTIADRFGTLAIEDTYKRAFKEWRGNYEYLTELVLVLNQKTWEWYKRDERKYQLYIKFYDEAAQWAEENLDGDELDYYYRTTD